MNIYLFSINKRPNSTKQPALSEGVLIQGQLKDETTFLNPVIRFSPSIAVGTFSPSMYNYAIIPAWLRYYYINNWEFLNGTWEASLTVDVLASYKTEIANTSAYVIRAAGASNGAIMDSFYPAKTDVQLQRVAVATSWNGVAPSGGCYVVGCINSLASDKIGAITYYALDKDQLASLLNYLFTSNIYTASSITEIGEGLFKSMFNPFQYIVSCIWFPFNKTSFGSEQFPVTVGYWTTSVNGIAVTNLAQTTYVTATIPNHPQISRGSFLNHAPYTKLTLYIPPFGSIPLDTNGLEIGNYLYSETLIDHITGLATIRVAISPSSSNLHKENILTERTSMIGVPIQLSQLMPDYANSLANVGSIIGSVLTGNFIGVGAGILSSVDSQMPKVTSLGANGSFTETLLAPHLICEYLKLTDEDNTEFGRPLCAVRTLGGLSGYIQCGEDDHSFSATKTETEEINRFLKNGFFYE